MDRRVIQQNQKTIEFKTTYFFPEESLVSTSLLRFWTFEEINKILVQKNLKVNEIYGDWDRSPFIPNQSKEIIFSVGINKSII